MVMITLFQFFKRFAAIVGFGFFLSHTSMANEHDATQPPPVKNIVMVIADGMGPVFPTAYRLFADDPNTAVIEPTIFDRHMVGTQRTAPAPASGLITDSAASATALAAGVKSYNGAIGVDVNKKPVESVLHRAKALGMRTGIAVTSQVNHATPASYIVHNEDRNNYNEIADSYLTKTINGELAIDVVLGGGWQYFLREDRNLVSDFQKQGFHYVDALEELSGIEQSKPLLGLFANKGMKNAIDHQDPTRLLTMTKAAVRQLEHEQGFFLMVEASQVDWAGHANDIVWAMHEMHDLAMTMEYLEQYVVDNPDTLVVLTADHSTGGLTIGVDGKYEFYPEKLRRIERSPQAMAEAALATAAETASQREVLPNLAKQLALPLSDKDLSDLNKSLQSAPQSKRPVRTMAAAIKRVIDRHSGTGWTTSGHTGIDVNVYAFGANHQAFAGNYDNTELAERMFRVLHHR